MEFAHEYIWMIFAGLGLLLIILEMAGLEMEFDLIIIGSAFTIGGLITWPFYNWISTVVVVCVLLGFYIAVGRAYVHTKWLAHKTEKTNIDAIMGKRGLTKEAITQYDEGRVKIGYEEWRARAEEDIAEGAQVEVVSISGVTLTVKKIEGGS
jgi:membrane protein implicated in regulation of membrane protease activity